MGRFLNPKALKKVRSEPVVPPYRPPQKTVFDGHPTAGTHAGVAVAEVPTAAQAEIPDQPRGLLNTVGLVSLGLYMVSPELNDICFHFLGMNPYVSAVSAILLAVSFLASGSAARGLRLPIGRYWALFTIVLICSVPFSTWPGNSLSQLEGYIPRGVLLFFAIAAFVVDVSAVKFFFLMQAARGLLLLMSCALWGSAGDGDRFAIEGSVFYSNANELALGLTTVVGFFLYLLVQKNVGKFLLGAIAFLADVFFLLKTGSRGGFLAIAVVLAFSIFFSARYRSRLLAMLVLVPLLVIAVPKDTLHRLTYIFADPTSASVQTVSDEGAVQSQIERTELFWKSVHLMMEHPLLGVGVGEFPDAVYQSDLANHTRSPALGTHNTYTQVGAETGFTGLIVYLMIVFTGIRMNYRIFRRTMTDERLAFFPLAALCLLTSSVGFAVGSTFHHVAWTGALPMLTGATAGLWQAFQKEAAKVGSPDLLNPQQA